MSVENRMECAGERQPGQYRTLGQHGPKCPLYKQKYRPFVLMGGILCNVIASNFFCPYSGLFCSFPNTFGSYVVDAPGGGGKIPVFPQYLISQSTDKVILRNYEGIICSYTEPEDKSGTCLKCNLCDDYRDLPITGIEKLFTEKKLSLVPQGNSRLRRQNEWEN